MVHKLTVGPMECNCYIVACDKSKESVVIDPGADSGRIKSLLKNCGLEAKYIVNTHGHADHIGANGALGLPVLIHRLDEEFLRDSSKNLSKMFFFKISSPGAARLLEDGDEIEFGHLRFCVLHTPGHTPGSISLVMGKAVFTGDTLFSHGIGRTDFPYGDEETLLKSVREKLLVLSDDTVVYPGHGPDSTIGVERRSNPFL